MMRSVQRGRAASTGLEESSIGEPMTSFYAWRDVAGSCEVHLSPVPWRPSPHVQDANTPATCPRTPGYQADVGIRQHDRSCTYTQGLAGQKERSGSSSSGGRYTQDGYPNPSRPSGAKSKESFKSLRLVEACSRDNTGENAPDLPGHTTSSVRSLVHDLRSSCE